MALGVLPSSAWAGDPEIGRTPAVGIGISTLGITGELSYRVIGNLVVRLNGNWADLGFDQTVDGNSFNGSVKVKGAGLIADWHPFANGFRLSGGARYHDAVFSGTVTGSDVTLNDKIYTAAQYGTLTAQVENDTKFAPYVGIGWDSSHFSESGFSIGIEAGVLFVGEQKATLTSSKTVPGLQADLDTEVTKIKSDYGKYGEAWPVLSIMAKYRF
ncbi:MAG: hypothetical protein AB7F78_04075 [Hyphomicrobiaceae bacterium]